MKTEPLYLAKRGGAAEKNLLGRKWEFGYAVG
jgi:hypothetical protein